MPILDTPLTAPMTGLAGRQDAYMRILSWEATMTRRRNKSRLQRYQESWFFYIGENISPGEYIQPLEINYIQATCEAHASYLWGQWEPQDRLVSWTLKSRNTKGDQADTKVMLQWIESLFNGHEDLLFASGLNQSIFGDAILRPRYDPLMEMITPESVLPEYYHARWSAHDINDIKEVIISYPIDRGDAEDQFGTRGDSTYATAVLGRAQKYAIYWELWTTECHEIWIDNVRVFEEPNFLVDTAGNPGQIPFVHIPGVRAGGEYYGQSDVEPVLLLQDELNRKMADNGDIISYAAHPIIQVRNYFGKVEKLPVGPDAIWDMGRDGEAAYLSGGTPPVDIEKYVDRLLNIFQDLSHMPAAAFGRSETAQASALALAMEMMPVTQRVGWKRLQWKQGLIAYVHMAARIAEHYDILPFARKDLLRYSIIPSFAGILPKDRSAAVQDNVSLVSAGLRTIQRALEDLGELDAATEAGKIIEELLMKVREGIMKNQSLNGKNGDVSTGGSADGGAAARDRGK